MRSKLVLEVYMLRIPRAPLPGHSFAPNANRPLPASIREGSCRASDIHTGVTFERGEARTSMAGASTYSSMGADAGGAYGKPYTGAPATAGHED